MKQRKADSVPEFQSLEEERQYWEARGPLAEGRKGRLNKPRPGQRRSSFLAVRLTSEELTRLRDVAKKRGVGPSTFARMVLLSALGSPSVETAGDLTGILETRLTQVEKDRLESLVEKLSIGEPQDPVALVVLGEKQTWEELALTFMKALLMTSGTRVFTAEDETYKKLKDIVTAQ